MPKLQPNEKEKADRIVRACIAYNMERLGLEDTTLTTCLGISSKTMDNRRARPETFTLGELRSLSKTLKLTPVQAASIVLGRPLTSREVRDFILL